jgi:Tol biopolymer transport system component
MQPVATRQPCQFTVSPSVDPTGKKVALDRSLCTDGTLGGLVLYDVATQQTTLLAPASIRGGPVFSPDGSGIAFIGFRGLTTYQDLLFYDFSMNRAVTAVQATSNQANQGVIAVAIAPDSAHFVVCTASDLYLYDRNALLNGPKRLTQDGQSCSPSW